MSPQLVSEVWRAFPRISATSKQRVSAPFHEPKRHRSNSEEQENRPAKEEPQPGLRNRQSHGKADADERHQTREPVKPRDRGKVDVLAKQHQCYDHRGDWQQVHQCVDLEQVDGCEEERVRRDHGGKQPWRAADVNQGGVEVSPRRRPALTASMETPHHPGRERHGDEHTQKSPGVTTRLQQELLNRHDVVGTRDADTTSSAARDK